MAVEIMQKTHVVTDKGAYLDAVIDQLSDDDVDRLNEDCPDEENKSIPFKPLI
jgi:hypothetical protein